MGTGQQQPPPPPPPPPTASQIQDSAGNSVQSDLDGLTRDVGGIAADLRDALTPATRNLLDHGFSDIVDVEGTPAAAAQRADPHRISFLLPNGDATVFSLGAGADDSRIINPGIRGRTNRHIGFEVSGADTSAYHTVLSLGWGTNDTPLDGKSHNPHMPSGIMGLTALTEGNAWLESKRQFYVMSREGDVVVRALTQAVLVQADAAAVDIVSGTTATVGGKHGVALVADGGVEIEDLKDDEHHQPVHVTAWINAIVKSATTLKDFHNSMNAFIATLKKTSQGPKPDVPGWKASSTNVGKTIVDGVKMFSTIVREGDNWRGKMHWGASVPSASVASNGYTSISGTISASLFGNASASVTSLLSASVLAASASLKGLLYASVWASNEASVKAKKDLKLEGETGKASLKAAKEVYIASTGSPGTLILQGEGDTRMNSVSGKTFVHSNSQTYVGAGSGNGYGIVIKGDTIAFGQIGSAEKFAEPAVKDEQFLKMTSEFTTMKLGTTKIGITKDSFSLVGRGGGSVKCDSSGNIMADGGKVLIG